MFSTLAGSTTYVDVYLKYNNKNVINIFESFELLGSVNSNFGFHCKIRYVASVEATFLCGIRGCLYAHQPNPWPARGFLGPGHKEFNRNVIYSSKGKEG